MTDKRFYALVGALAALVIFGGLAVLIDRGTLTFDQAGAFLGGLTVFVTVYVIGWLTPGPTQRPRD